MYVTVINVPNAFIQTRIQHEQGMAIIKIRGILVDVLLDLAPYVYGTYVTNYRKRIKKLIAPCTNAIYGNMVESLLYYYRFFKTLKLNKFRINPYDPCVTNVLVNGLQQYIIFHVDGFNFIYKNNNINDSFIGVLWEEYQSIFENGSGKMEVNRVKVHKHLGMKLDYSTVGQVKITMLEYTDEILDTFDKTYPMGGGT